MSEYGEILQVDRVRRPSPGNLDSVQPAAGSRQRESRDRVQRESREIVQKTEFEDRVRVTWTRSFELPETKFDTCIPADLSVLELAQALTFT